jgi:cytochrome c556
MFDRGVDFRLNTSANTDRLPSPAIWSRVPFEQIKNGEIDGIAFYDDFTDLPLTPTLTTQIAYGKYKAFGDTGKACGACHDKFRAKAN